MSDSPGLYCNLKLNYNFLCQPWWMFLIAQFHWWFLFYPMTFFIAFSKLLENHFFFLKAMFKTNRSLTKCFFDNTKLATQNISISCFSANQGLFTPSFNCLDTGEKIIITSSVTKDVYIRPRISLIRHHMQIYTSYLYFGG